MVFFFFSHFSGWNNRFWDPEPLWAKTNPGNGFSSQSVPCDAAAHLGVRPIPEELIRGLGTGVFFHETEAILGPYVMQQQGSRWNLTFILTDSLYGYAMEVYAKGEVQRLRRWRATRGCSPFGAVYAPAGPSDPYMSQKHRRSERWTLG